MGCRFSRPKKVAQTLSMGQLFVHTRIQCRYLHRHKLAIHSMYICMYYRNGHICLCFLFFKTISACYLLTCIMSLECLCMFYHAVKGRDFDIQYCLTGTPNYVLKYHQYVYLFFLSKRQQGDQIGRIFSPIGELFTLGSLLKITKTAYIFGLLSHAFI
jgi:hypothetical protein